MSVGSLIKLTFVLWLCAEFLAFMLVAKTIGLPAAFLLALLTTIIGWTLLKRAGSSAMIKLRATLDGRRIIERNGRDVLDDTLASLGALALLIPGFLSDAGGLVLAIPAARARLARWLETSRIGRTVRRDVRGADHGPATIDLNPSDWERTGPSQGPAAKY